MAFLIISTIALLCHVPSATNCASLQGGSCMDERDATSLVQLKALLQNAADRSVKEAPPKGEGALGHEPSHQSMEDTLSGDLQRIHQPEEEHPPERTHDVSHQLDGDIERPRDHASRPTRVVYLPKMVGGEQILIPQEGGGWKVVQSEKMRKEAPERIGLAFRWSKRMADVEDWGPMYGEVVGADGVEDGVWVRFEIPLDEERNPNGYSVGQPVEALRSDGNFCDGHIKSIGHTEVIVTCEESDGSHTDKTLFPEDLLDHTYLRPIGPPRKPAEYDPPAVTESWTGGTPPSEEGDRIRVPWLQGTPASIIIYDLAEFRRGHPDVTNIMTEGLAGCIGLSIYCEGPSGRQGLFFSHMPKWGLENDAFAKARRLIAETDFTRVSVTFNPGTLQTPTGPHGRYVPLSLREITLNLAYFLQVMPQNIAFLPHMSSSIAYDLEHLRMYAVSAGQSHIPATVFRSDRESAGPIAPQNTMVQPMLPAIEEMISSKNKEWGLGKVFARTRGEEKLHLLHAMREAASPGGEAQVINVCFAIWQMFHKATVKGQAVKGLADRFLASVLPSQERIQEGSSRPTERIAQPVRPGHSDQLH